MFGYAPAWVDARRLNRSARKPLKERIGSEAICLCRYKDTKFEKTPIIHTVDDDNVYTAWSWSRVEQDWVECDTWEYSIDNRVACMGAMNNRRRQLESENLELKQSLSQARLDHELLRHDYERIRPKPTSNHVNWFAIAMFCFLLAICMLPGANAVSSSTEVHYYEDAIVEYINGTVREAINFLGSLVRDESLVTWIASYRFTAIVLGMLSLWRAERPAITLALLIAAYLTRYRYVAIASTAYMTSTSTITLGLVMVVDMVDTNLSLCLAGVQLCVVLVLGLFLDDVKYLQLVKGHFAVLAAAVISFMAKVLNLPDLVVVAVLVVWRLCVVLQLIGDKVEVKDGNGKVKTVVSSKPAWLSKVAGVGGFFQGLRKKTSVPVRVLTNSILGVEGQAGLGTGFRVANNIVTASHVVGSDSVVRVTWGTVNSTARVIRHLGNDVAILSLPTELQAVQPFKFAKTISDETVVVTGMNSNCDYIVAVADGVVVKDQWTYAIQTLDGMSGAPVTNSTGRVVGVHLSNTGFTGGGAVLRAVDLNQDNEVERLKKEIESLKNKVEAPTPDGQELGHLNQCSDSNEIVNLIRIAIRNEMEVLRAELNAELGFEQAKGKNKVRGGKGARRKRRAAFTEEEYKALQEKGYTRNQLKDMAEVLLEKIIIDEGDEGAPTGYPEWGDLDEAETLEIEQDWKFGQKQEQPVSNYPIEKCSVEIDYNPNTHSCDVYDKYSLSVYYVTESDVKALGSALSEYDDFVMKWMMRNLNIHQDWRTGVDTAKALKEIADARLGLEEKMVECGLVPFSQRKKKERKSRPLRKLKEAPKN